MKNDANTLCQMLLKEKRIRLSRIPQENVFAKGIGFALDESGALVGLNLSHQALRDIAFLRDFQTLQHLDLSKNMIANIAPLADLKNLSQLNLTVNEIKDIACLKLLKKLNWMNLAYNKIKVLPSDILDWGMEIKWNDKGTSGIILAGNPMKESWVQAIEMGRKTLGEYLHKCFPNTHQSLPAYEPILPNLTNRTSSRGEKKTILILVANPNKISRTDFDEEIYKIEESLEYRNVRRQFNVIPKFMVKLADIRKALLYYRPQIVHFIGHGDEDGLKLEDHNRNISSISNEVLSDLFRLCSKDIKIVILSSCYSASQANAISKHIKYVIGMLDKIMNDAAIEFAVGFYDGLAGGRSIKDSFDFGCNAIQHLYKNFPAHLIPVLLKKEDSLDSLAQ